MAVHKPAETIDHHGERFAQTFSLRHSEAGTPTLVVDDGDNQDNMVTAAGLTRRQGFWFERATVSPVFISHHHRVSHVLTTVDWFNAHLNAQVGPSEDPVTVIRQATDPFGEGFIWIDRDLRVKVMNMAAARHFDVDREQATGRTIVELKPDIVDALVHGKIKLTLRDGSVHSVDAPSAVRADAWVHFETFPFRGGAACWFRNITEEVRAHRYADMKTAILKAMDCHGSVGYVRLSPRLTIDRANHAFGDMVRIGVDRLTGVSFLDLIGRQNRAAVREWLEDAFRGQSLQTCDFQLLSNDGSLFDIRAGCAELRGVYANEGAVLVLTPRNIA